jgi:hypothetical protein
LNVIAGDGMDIEDWTRGGEVDSVTSLMKLTLNPVTSGAFDAFENDFPGSHGRLRFMSGELAGVTLDIGTFDALTGVTILRQPMPRAPEAGDAVDIEAGCDKSFDGNQGCTFYSNEINFRGFVNVPGRDAVRRRYDT